MNTDLRQGFARVNWKAFRELAKPSKKVSPYWNKPAGRSVVKFIPNPSTTPEKLVRVKVGRSTKLFRAPKASKIQLVDANRNTTEDKDRGACTVNALAIAANVPWFVAKAALKRAGRHENRGFDVSGKKVAGFKFTRVLRGSTSLAKFIAAHPVGRFYVQTTNHAFAVVHGKVMDWLSTCGANRKLVDAWTVKVDNKE